MNFSYANSDFLQLTVSQNGVDVTAHYMDESVSGGSVLSAADQPPYAISVTAGPTTIVSTPSSGMVRRLAGLTLHNTYAGSNTLTLKISAGASLFFVDKFTLLQDETAFYERGRGFYAKDANGNAKEVTSSIFSSLTVTGNATVGGTLGVTGATALSAALTYGGVTLTNAVTGTGKMVLDTSPTLATPILGTPTSGTLTNCTIPASALTGTTLAASVVTSSITTVGALNAGSITSGFGSINVGADSISGGAISGTTGTFSGKLSYTLVAGAMLEIGNVTNNQGYNLAFGVENGNGMLFSKAGASNNAGKICRILRDDSANGNSFDVYATDGSTVGVSLNGTGAITGGAISGTSYAVGATAGIDTTITTANLVGKTITVSKGIITGFA